MNRKKYIETIFLILITLFQTGCKKYLDQKPQQSLTVPSTLGDLQALLDNNSYVNRNQTPGLLEGLSDNYYINSTNWQSLVSSASTLKDALTYEWDKDVTSSVENWQGPYQGPIYYANVVLDVLPNIDIDTDNQVLCNNVKGSALFYRAFAFHQLAQIYCRPYSSSASIDLGIVLKASSDIHEPIKRSTVQETYDRVIADLKTAAELLPITTLVSTRPNKAAAYGALARTYLSMSDYSNAGHYADLSLQQNSSLMDYNTVTGLFQRFNIETLYFNGPLTGNLLSSSRAKVDSNLYNSYNINDLRKTKYFKANTGANVGTYVFNGSYLGISSLLFDGITTDEMYLIRAECNARAGNKDAAMSDLNALMVKRWKNNGTWAPFTAIDANDAKNKILVERRKELLFRCLRWSDIRRLNMEGANITLTRILNGVSYTLPPNDLRSVLLIPQEEINLSGIQQNPR